MSEKEIDMNDLINSFDECSTDYSKTACTYYGDYLRNYQKEKTQLQNNWNELKKWLETIVEDLEKSQTLRFNHSIDFKLKAFKNSLYKMQELENRKV